MPQYSEIPPYCNPEASAEDRDFGSFGTTQNAPSSENEQEGPETGGGWSEGDNGAASPLDGLVEKTASDPGAPFVLDVLECLAALKMENRAAFEALRAQLKKAGCRVTALDEAIAEELDEEVGRGPTQIGGVRLWITQGFPITDEQQVDAQLSPIRTDG